MEQGYARPDDLVSTEWVAERLDDPGILLVESNEDPLLYATGHIPGAHEVDWTRDLNDPVVRDYLDGAGFARLMDRLGASPDTRIIFYGDRNNWWACYALWVFRLFGHENCSIMNGGRIKWVQEGRPLTRESAPVRPAVGYPVRERDDSEHRAFRQEVLAHVQAGGRLVDVRSPAEFSGEKLHMEGYPNEGALRGGHIPGAANVPWARAVNPETGEFLPPADLERIYMEEAGLTREEDVVAYCRIGERSSHTWFVLRSLLGFTRVRNYDGSWTEWGNTVGVPIERG
ncbi:MAG: sulfurtransferase [Fimbriimonadaceae bacterium]|nr:sulfurtransferase [Fimbriimonadaceae bacterium]